MAYSWTMGIEFFLCTQARIALLNPSRQAGLGVLWRIRYFQKSVSRCELSWFHKVTNFCFLSATQYSYNSESPYLVNTAKGKGVVRWLVGQLKLVACMIDEWHLQRRDDGTRRGRGGAGGRKE
jgi:hypothetical protein